jgi:hypothetical protein
MKENNLSVVMTSNDLSMKQEEEKDKKIREEKTKRNKRIEKEYFLKCFTDQFKSQISLKRYHEKQQLCKKLSQRLQTPVQVTKTSRKITDKTVLQDKITHLLQKNKSFQATLCRLQDVNNNMTS